MDEVTVLRERTKDRRVRRTERALRAALAALIHEKSYDDIAVKEILDRADVGRSTFYAHFRDKDELLASCMRELLGAHGGQPSGGCASAVSGATSWRDRLLAFSLPVLEFHAARRRAGTLTVDAGTRALLHERLGHLLTGRLATELGRGGRAITTSANVPSELLARQIASTFGVVLTWWLEDEHALAPRDVDARFRALVSPILESVAR